MKKLLLISFSLFSINSLAVCIAPISRTNVGTNTVLTSTKYNADLNTAYNKVNNLPGDCIVDESINGGKLINTTVTGDKLVNNTVTTGKIADGAITAAKLASAIENLVPIGTVLSFVGSAAPSGYLLCDGRSLSRTTYAGLFAVIGTAYGSIDGNSFNLPDFRHTFLRGNSAFSSVTGSGTASSNNGTFSAHGINRTGMKVRLSSGALSGLSVDTTYYAIVVDSNTLAFATTYDNSIAATKISISGSNTATIRQWEDPDSTVRQQAALGGNSSGLGTRQEAAFLSHTHGIRVRVASAINGRLTQQQAMADQVGHTVFPDTEVTHILNASGGNDTRPVNASVNYIIKH